MKQLFAWPLAYSIHVAWGDFNDLFGGFTVFLGFPSTHTGRVKYATVCIYYCMSAQPVISLQNQHVQNSIVISTIDYNLKVKLLCHGKQFLFRLVTILCASDLVCHP